MESIKDKVAIIGMGASQSFGELWGKDIDDLIVEAATEAVADAGVSLKDIQAGWSGSAFAGGGISLSTPLQLQFIPVTRIENAAATGADAIRSAAFALLSKLYDIVIAVGFEKMRDRTQRRGGGESGTDEVHSVYGDGVSDPERYAMTAIRYFHQYGLSPDEGKRMLAMIASKNRFNGARNPRAMFQEEVSVEDIMNAPSIAGPLGLYDCSVASDGAVAAVLCRTEDARAYRKNYVTIKGMGTCTGPGMGKSDTKYDFTHWEETERAARQAYEQAGIKNPREELDMVEVHDCFSIAEAIAIESLGLCEKGTVMRDIEAGTFTLEGDLPVNASGGLLSFGHPIGASGVRGIYEIYKQIQGKAESPARQLKNVRMGLSHSQGGHPGRFQCSVTIIGAP
ncbi:MAG: acetyl-CoA acetyltransferase [Chloroflexi bacterium]|nr:acetyl-CoA acetyltransferase [Chloroflexota bacterium]